MRTTAPSGSARAFTLIEIMLVISIMAIIMAASIPMVNRVVNRDPLTKAIIDVIEGCKAARDRAILSGDDYALVLDADRNLNVTAKPRRTSLAPAAQGGSITKGVSMNGEFPRKINEEVLIENIFLNMEEVGKRSDVTQVVVRFSPNGTCDDFFLTLSWRGKTRLVRTDIITGLADEVPTP